MILSPIVIKAAAALIALSFVGNAWQWYNRSESEREIKELSDELVKARLLRDNDARTIQECDASTKRAEEAARLQQERARTAVADLLRQMESLGRERDEGLERIRAAGEADSCAQSLVPDDIADLLRDDR